ncbi:MAG: DUF488 domain-containing protein [Chloroflexota bacterium]
MSTGTLRLPEKTVNEQRQGKVVWNLEHCTSAQPDFYSIGYSGRDIRRFVEILKTAGVATLVDIRYAPISRFRPEFSKYNLKKAVEAEGISYVHRSDLGVPRDIRAFSIGKRTRDDIWAWYDTHILPNIAKKNLDEFFNSMEHPVAFMCVEYDPTECHRHRVFLGLEHLGFTGCEL